MSRKRVSIEFVEPSQTIQAHADECMVGNLLAQYSGAGLLPPAPLSEPSFVDCFDIPDFAEMHNRLLKASSSFSALPADVREIFDNDPSKFSFYVNDPSNASSMHEVLGHEIASAVFKRKGWSLDSQSSVLSETSSSPQVVAPTSNDSK